MGQHNSVPFNPKIAGVFFRAGYIESWGRGIQKICDACETLGAEKPEYSVSGSDIMVVFKALQSAVVADSKTPNRQNVGLDVGLDVGIETQVFEIISENPQMTMMEIAQKLNVTKRTIERVVKILREKNLIERKGGKRYGYWEVQK